MECSINGPALPLLMKHLVIGLRLKTPNFSAFHWSPRGSLVSIGQHFVATRVVHLRNWTKADLITSYCSYVRPAQPGLIRTRLCGQCIAVIAGSCTKLGLFLQLDLFSDKNMRNCFSEVFSSNWNPGDLNVQINRLLGLCTHILIPHLPRILLI